MSEVGEENNSVVETLSCCACCGIAEVDDIKLKPCDDCDLVRYCSDECKNNHKPEHEEACKKRTTELREELLFKQPEGSHLGDCPICCLPLPLFDGAKSYQCCSKKICNGCAHANDKRQVEMRRQYACPFCRELTPFSAQERDRQRMKRIEANDPEAMCMEGMKQHQKGKYRKAFKFYTMAAELGNADAHSRLADLYHNGEGVEKDKEKYLYHLEEASIGGHPHARCNLGGAEWNSGDKERAVKHWIIAARQGEDKAIKVLMDAFRKGSVEKEVLAAAFRAHKAAVDATKSPQREVAEETVSK